MLIPLDPPATVAVAKVPRAGGQAAGFVTSKDMMHPEVATGQPMVVPVSLLPVTLIKIRSVAPLMDSVTGEHPTLAVVTCGPGTGKPITPAVIGICHTVAALTPGTGTDETPQTYKFPVPSVELK